MTRGTGPGAPTEISVLLWEAQNAGASCTGSRLSGVVEKARPGRTEPGDSSQCVLSGIAIKQGPKCCSLGRPPSDSFT